MSKKLNIDTVQNELRSGSAFFPGYRTPEEPEEQTPPAATAPEQTQAEPKQERKNERKLASKNARMQEAGIPVPPPSSLHRHDGVDELFESVHEPATITNSFRYTPTELSQLDDVAYELLKRYGARVSKQDVARLGLNAVMRDFLNQGDQSLLAQFAARAKRSKRRKE
jgi:hypothetical protein